METVIESWSSLGGKTVIVLDRSSYFTQVSSNNHIQGDFAVASKDIKKTNNRYSEQPPILPFEQSLWTCTVEAVVGYTRLVWDIFSPSDKRICILSAKFNESAGPQISEVCTWSESDQNLEKLLRSLAKDAYTDQIKSRSELLQTNDISALPNCRPESLHMTSALSQALDKLTKAPQLEPLKTDTVGLQNLKKSEQTGRIMILSSFQSEETIKHLVNQFQDMLTNQHNSSNSNESSKPSLKYCDLIVVNTYPINDTGPTSTVKDSSIFKPNMHCKVYSVKSGPAITGLLNNLCLQHYNLKSTTITGIPMKEEQNASSSAQYDVEVVHCSSIHEEISNDANSLFEGCTKVIDRNGYLCDTYKLSWCLAKKGGDEINHCIASSRMTVVDVDSRPAACLTTFLLHGRSVVLEVFKSKSNRMSTHLLACHNGELYIHSLALCHHRSDLGSYPSITENLGGKVGDYRMNDFVNFMKQHKLCRTYLTDEPLKKTLSLLKRQTLYWPLTIGHTILWNVPALVGKLLNLIPKESLPQIEVEECKRTIDQLVKAEKDGHALPSVSIAEVTRGSGMKSGKKLEQMYKIFWNELEYFLRVHSTTREHEAVLEYFLERNNDKKPEAERGLKRAASSTGPGALKKSKQTVQLVPEISDTNAALLQTAVFFKTGMSLWQTWTSMHHHLNKSRNKLPIHILKPE